MRYIHTCIYIHIDIDPVHDSIDECSNGFLCNRDPDLVKKIGAATALEVRATGIQYTFAPCIAVRKYSVKTNFQKLLFVLYI